MQTDGSPFLSAVHQKLQLCQKEYRSLKDTCDLPIAREVNPKLQVLALISTHISSSVGIIELCSLLCRCDQYFFRNDKSAWRGSLFCSSIGTPKSAAQSSWFGLVPGSPLTLIPPPDSITEAGGHSSALVQLELNLEASYFAMFESLKRPLFAPSICRLWLAFSGSYVLTQVNRLA